MANMEDDPDEITILLVGDDNVGKSTFLSRITHPPHAPQPGLQSSSLGNPTPPPLHDSNQPFVFDVRFSSSAYRLEFYDTASPTPWQELSPDVIVLCYDISRKMTLDGLTRWHRRIVQTFKSLDDVPVLLLGLKRDLRNSRRSRNQNAQFLAAAAASHSDESDSGPVIPQEGHRVAQELRCDRYLECSALTGELVREVLEDIARTAAMTKRDEGGKSQGGCRVM